MPNTKNNYKWNIASDSESDSDSDFEPGKRRVLFVSTI